jgi:hypothetical protein
VVASTRARWVSVLSWSDHCRDSVRLRVATAVRLLQQVPAAGQLDQGVLYLHDARLGDQLAGGLAGQRHGQLGEPGRHREPGRGPESGRVRLQLAAVVGEDGAPARVGVGLGEREQHEVDPLAGLDEELQLGLGERRRRVDDEQQRGGAFHRVERDLGVQRVQAADARSVDQGQVLQQRRRVLHLDVARGAQPVGQPAEDGAPVAQVAVAERHRVFPARHVRAGAVRGGVGELQVRRGGDRRVDRGQAGHADEHVDQRAFPAFGLTDDDDRGPLQLAAADHVDVGRHVRVDLAQEREPAVDRAAHQLLRGRVPLGGAAVGARLRVGAHRSSRSFAARYTVTTGTRSSRPSRSA